MTTIINSPAATASIRPMPWLDKLCHLALCKQLALLREGRISVEQEAGKQAFGDPAAGDDHTAAITVHRPRFFRRSVLGGSNGAAESYIRGDWDCENLTQLFRIFIRNMDTADRIEGGTARITAPIAKACHALRANTRRGSAKNIHAHYDLGNEFFELFLDPTMTYSCGIFEKPESIMHDASIAKIDRLCQMLRLGANDHLLEIGTGWGALAIHAARNYGCRVTTTTISREQYDLARRRIASAGLSDRIEVVLKDYRDLAGQYDKLVSVEMIEAVGHEYLPEYFRCCAALLKPDGLMALQAITMPDHRYEQYRRSVDFIRRFIFPGSCVPSLAAMTQSIAKSSDLRVLKLDDFGPHYARTVRHWLDRFNEKVEAVRALGYDESFIRMWRYYFCYCEAGFVERYTGLVQMLLARPGCRRESPASCVP